MPENIQRKVRPTHPGAILKNMLEELAADENGQVAVPTQKELAKRLGVSTRAITDLMHARRAMTADGYPFVTRVQDHARHLDESAEGSRFMGCASGE